MKKKLLIPISILLILLVLVIVFWDPILDFLPIDQSGWKVRDGQHFYLNGDGDPLTGWQTLDGSQYYFDPASGAMQTGWLTLSDGTYYLDPDGTMRTGWHTEDGERCYLLADGRLATGWLELDGSRYFMDASGHPVTGLFETGGAHYYADGSGVLQTGWQKLGDTHRYFAADGTMYTGWLDDGDNRYYLDESGILQTGWLETPEGRCYLDENGVLQFGWLQLEDGLYYLGQTGLMHTGWLELDGQKYYLKEDGTAAKGKLVIGDLTYYFTSTGANIIMVNRWNSVPEDYTTELTALPNGRLISVECYDSLMAMVEACTAAGCNPNVIDGNRTTATQRYLFNDRINYYMEKGYDYGTAFALTKESVADPGTSEHELGLAVDILDRYYPTSYTGEQNCLTWLSEHCWEYGWILRYPESRKQITGIKFEPWHFRYVGVELAMELKDSGLCLEEYLDALTGDGTTCGNPDAVKS